MLFFFLPWMSQERRLLNLKGFFWGSACWLHGVRPGFCPSLVLHGLPCKVMSVTVGSRWAAMGTTVSIGSQGNVSCKHVPRPQRADYRGFQKNVFSLQTQPRLVTRLWFHFSFLFFTTDYKTSNSQSLNWKWEWWYSLTHLVQAPLMLVRSWTMDASWTAISQIFKKQRREYLEFYIARIDCCEHKPQVCIVTQKFRSLSSNGRFRQTQCSLIFTRSRDLHLEMSNSTPPQTSELTCSTPNMSNCFSFSFERKLKERKRQRKRNRWYAYSVSFGSK